MSRNKQLLRMRRRRSRRRAGNKAFTRKFRLFMQDVLGLVSQSPGATIKVRHT